MSTATPPPLTMPPPPSMSPDRFSCRRLIWSVLVLMVIPFAWPSAMHEGAGGRLVFATWLTLLTWLLMCIAILSGVVALLFPRRFTLSALIWIWVVVLAVQILDYAIAGTLLLAGKAHLDPMALAGSFGASCGLGLAVFFCLRKVCRERRMPVASQEYKVREDSVASDKMFQEAIRLESRNRYDEALALYRRILAEYPQSRSAADAECSIRSIEKLRNP